MSAAALAAIAAFQVEGFGKDNQPIFHIVINGALEIIFFTGLICICHIP